MASPSLERKIRRSLFLIRFLQAYIPLPLSRRLITQGLARVQLRGNVARQAVSANGVSCEWIIPQGSPKGKVLLYLHGGGFVYGLTPLHLEMVAYLAKKIGIRALMVDYRLGPEHPFPAALDDCVTSYHWLLDQSVPAHNIVVAGDSAGGNLTITMLMKLRDSGEQIPVAAACLSPAADLSVKRDSFNDPLLHPKAVKMFHKSYLAHNDPRDPYLSPVFGDFRGLPPLLIHAGEDEILCDDAVRIEALAKAAGVETQLEIYPRMWHVWQLFLALPQAFRSLDDIAQFLRSHLEGSA